MNEGPERGRSHYSYFSRSSNSGALVPTLTIDYRRNVTMLRRMGRRFPPSYTLEPSFFASICFMNEYRKQPSRIMRTKILRNIARCKSCGDVLESTHVHDFNTCKCGKLSVDGGLEYLRRLGNFDNCEEMSVIETAEKKAEDLA